MEPSPLTQDSRPEIFQPKIIRLYEQLFREDDEDTELSEGFWQEFFLHRPDSVGLKRILGSIAPDEMLHQQAHSQQLLRRAIIRVKQARPPADEIALETLTVFLDATLTKKFTNPSSDIISVLAGLHDADAVMTDFVATLDTVIRNGRTIPLRLKAIRATLSITAAGFHTALPSYFTHRDLFPSLMKYVQDCEDSAEVLPAFYLLGLLANYNKFEFQNPYRLRLDDFVNDAIIQKMIACFGKSCLELRDAYIAVQDDMPEGWTLGSTLSYIGLGALAPNSRPSTPVPAPEEAKSLFAVLPGPEIGVLLSTYDFANANKVFCFNLISLQSESNNDTSPLSAYLSLTSYLFQHAHRSTRATLYTYLSLFVLQILVEDQLLLKRLCNDETKLSVRLCRQRQPFLPIVKGERIPVAVIVDLMVDGINHNLRRRLDVEFYVLCLGVLLRILSYLSRAKARISYHWSELWRTLLAFVRFLTTYENDIKTNYRSTELITTLVNLLAFALSNGENFLPDPASYDDLFYKLVESGDTLIKFRDAFGLSSQSGSMQTLINVSSHYHSLLESNEKGKTRNKHLSPREVSTVIKQGYETLSIDASEGLDRWEKFREADFKTVLKKIARAAMDDAKTLSVQ
ncbi:Nn.00g092150.m01.CDS01 [Neocucurbitaria sp. VM-36]